MASWLLNVTEFVCVLFLTAHVCVDCVSVLKQLEWKQNALTTYITLTNNILNQPFIKQFPLICTCIFEQSHNCTTSLSL